MRAVSEQRAPARHCKVCHKATNGRKPVCSNHVDAMPYVQSVYAKMQRREDDLKDLENLQHDSPLIDEIQGLIFQFGGVSYENAARHLSLDVKQIKLIAKYMKDQQLIKIRMNARKKYFMVTYATKLDG